MTEALQEKTIVRPTQAETGYTPLSATVDKACANCRWFVGARTGYSADGSAYIEPPVCHLIESWPLDIQPTGYCERHELLPQLEQEDEPSVEQILSTAEEVIETVVDIVEPFIDYSDQAKALEPTTPEKRISVLAQVKALLNDATQRRAKIEHTGFKAYGDKWVAWFTNNFEDREGEFFALKAMDEFVERVETGLVPYPELWYWHIKGTKHGQSTWLGRIGHFLVAAGTFDDTPQGRAAQKSYTAGKETYALSHGFTFDPDTKQGNVYRDFNTFEISTLPRKAAANPYTDYQVKELKMLKPEQKAGLEKLFTPQIVADFIATTEATSKAIVEAGIASKEFTHVSEVVTPASPAPEAVKAVETSITDLFLNMAGDQADMAQTLVTVTKAHKQLETDTDGKITEMAATIKAQGETIAALKALVEDRPRVASKAAENVVTMDELPDGVQHNIKSGDIDPFWNPAK